MQLHGILTVRSTIRHDKDVMPFLIVQPHFFAQTEIMGEDETVEKLKKTQKLWSNLYRLDPLPPGDGPVESFKCVSIITVNGPQIHNILLYLYASPSLLGRIERIPTSTRPFETKRKSG